MVVVIAEPPVVSVEIWGWVVMADEEVFVVGATTVWVVVALARLPEVPAAAAAEPAEEAELRTELADEGRAVEALLRMEAAVPEAVVPLLATLAQYAVPNAMTVAESSAEHAWFEQSRMP